MKKVCKQDRFDFDFHVGLKLTLKKLDSYDVDITESSFFGAYYRIDGINLGISMSRYEFSKYFYNDIEVRKVKLERLNENWSL